MIRITEELISNCHEQLVRSIAVAEVAQELGLPKIEVLSLFETAVAESRQTLSLLRNLELPVNARILEVGAGYGLASICLAMMKFEVTSLEPGGLGFEKNRTASLSFAESCGVRLSHIMHGAEDADFSNLEKFDLVISNNVLEHIPDVNRALTNLNNAVSRQGIMIHSCANYSFPFEPHFGIPLLPGVPNLTSRILPKSITQTGLWRSLNFIKFAQVKRNVRHNGMACVFRSGTMSKSVRRLQTDEKFAERHPYISRIVTVPILFRLSILATSLPKRIATPMDFLICFPESVGSSNVENWKNAS